MFPMAKWGSQTFDLPKLANSCHVKWNKRSFFLIPISHIFFAKPFYSFCCFLLIARTRHASFGEEDSRWLHKTTPNHGFWSDYNSLARQEIHTRFAGYISCVYLERNKKSLAAQVPYYLNAYVRRLRRGSYTSVSSLSAAGKNILCI